MAVISLPETSALQAKSKRDIFNQTEAMTKSFTQSVLRSRTSFFFGGGGMGFKAPATTVGRKLEKEITHFFNIVKLHSLRALKLHTS